VACKNKFSKNIDKLSIIVVCPICGKKQKYHCEVMGAGENGKETLEEYFSWDDDF
jgi:predicted amidophosphoribosyltransferase